MIIHFFKQALKHIDWLLFILLIPFCFLYTTAYSHNIGMANPASKYCDQVGGKVFIEKDNKGNEYGVCKFGNKHACEEWALFKGKCPKGGIDISMYKTRWAYYCVIQGYIYTPKFFIGTAKEVGTCQLKTGKVCDAKDYYNNNNKCVSVRLKRDKH